MPRILAIEWEAQEIRYAVARTGRGGLIQLERAVAVRIPPAADGAKLSATELGLAIRTELTGKALRGANALVGVSRSAVELRQLGLPPAPEEELPELVRHQAAREFTAIGEGAALDFVAAPHDTPTARMMTAAALSEEQLALTRAVCDAARIKPRRLLLHPYSAAALLARRATEPVALLVDSGSEETDLSVLIGGRVFLCRTVRTQVRASDEQESAEAVESSPLVAEIKRTAIAAQNQAGGGTVAAVYVCGSAEREPELVRQLREELTIPVQVFDPFESFAVGKPLAEAPPEQPGRFAALLGMLADEVAQTQSAFDFLNPRRKPKPVNRRRLIGVGAGALVAVALLGAYLAWEQFAEVADKIARLEKRSRDLDQLVKRGSEKQAAVTAIEDWSLGDVVWLDELRDLSLRFPQSRDAVLLRLTLTARPTGGGAVELEGLVRDPSIVGRMESQLRDEYHEVRTRRVQESVQGKTNTWKFDSSLAVSRRSKDDYLAHQPVTTSARTNSPAALASESNPPTGSQREGNR